MLDAAATWDGPIPGKDRVRIVVAGAPPPTRTIERIESELGWEFVQIYGLTETSPLLTMNRRRAEYDDLDPTDARAAARSRRRARARRAAAASTRRARCWRAATWCSRATGTSPRPPPTRSSTTGSTPATAASLDDDGYLTISDRKKDVIISGGENVSSIEVEDALCSHPQVVEAAVIGVPDEKWGETVKALVVLAPGATVDEDDLMEHCRGRLAHFKCPTSVELRDSLTRTATGKLQKFKLREPYWEGRTRQVG